MGRIGQCSVDTTKGKLLMFCCPAVCVSRGIALQIGIALLSITAESDAKARHNLADT